MSQKLDQQMSPLPAITNLNIHTHADGLGAPIPSNGIVDNAITEPKLATGAVSTRSLGDGQVTIDKIDPTLANHINSTIVALAHSPGFYQCSEPMKWIDRTKVRVPDRLWLNIGTKGYIKEADHEMILDLTDYLSWDYQATKWVASTAYKKYDAVYFDDIPDAIFYCTTEGTSSTDPTAFKATTAAPTEDGTNAVLDGTCVWNSVTSYVKNAEKRAGLDVFIYALAPETGTLPKIVLSTDYDAPFRFSTKHKGLPAPTEQDKLKYRKIGGFHCECLEIYYENKYNWLAGLKTGDIVPFSVYDWSHRPEAGLVPGHAWIAGCGVWISMYLLSYSDKNLGKDTQYIKIELGQSDADPTLSSNNKGIIATGQNPIQFYPVAFMKQLSKQGLKLPNVMDLYLASVGVGDSDDQPGAGYIRLKGGNNGIGVSNSKWELRKSGGHVANHNDRVRIVSSYGLEDVLGVVHCFTSEIWWANNAMHHNVIGGTADDNRWLYSSDNGIPVSENYQWLFATRSSSDAITCIQDVPKYLKDLVALIKDKLKKE